MVMTMSAARTWPVVSRLGNSREMSRPISAMAWTTAGLSWLAGCDPAEVTRTRQAASWSRRAAAIWDRPALWVQTNSTSGGSVMLAAFRVRGGELVAGAFVQFAGNGDVGGFAGGDAGVQGFDHGDGERTAGELGGDEGRRGGRGDAGEGVGEHPADGDGRIGEAG